MNRTFFRTCDRCGASLDPGEVCDCERQKKIPRLEILAERCSEDATNGKSIYETMGEALESFTTCDLLEYVSDLGGSGAARYYLEQQIIGAAINYLKYKENRA